MDMDNSVGIDSGQEGWVVWRGGQKGKNCDNRNNKQ